MATSLQLRRDVAKLSTLAAADIALLRRLSEDEAIEALRDILPALVAQYGAAAAVVAAEWYDDYRVEREVARQFAATPVAAGDRGAQALIGWALTTAQTDGTFWDLVNGGVQKRIADHSRLTVAGASIADPSARGWKRVGVGECAWCRMLIGRGAVYSETTVTFRAHDSCQCGAVPEF